MGQFKQRLATTITADLVRWRRVSQYEFIGTVWNSVDQEYVDNHLVRIQFMDVFHYPNLSRIWDEHYLGKTITGNYIRMERKHELGLGK